MKLTNLVIHLLNGLLLFLLLRRLPGLAAHGRPAATASGEPLALLVTALWLLHPINLTSVLYVVQRMESLAQVFVLLGLILYVEARSRLAAGQAGFPWRLWLGVPACVVAGVAAKETAVLLPVLTLVLEFTLFRTRPGGRQMVAFHVVFLLVPALVGLAWLLPRTMDSPAWAFRDFTMGERLLTQPGVLLSYLAWTVLPLPGFFGFYRDAWPVSSGLLQPWTTLPALAGLVVLVAAVFVLRRRRPLVTLGLGWFLAAHLLTATFLPLERCSNTETTSRRSARCWPSWPCCCRWTSRVRVPGPHVQDCLLESHCWPAPPCCCAYWSGRIRCAWRSPRPTAILLLLAPPTTWAAPWWYWAATTRTRP